ncbi:glucoamylase family protein [Vibrio tapetis]|uniref:Putative membrane protein n=1 Tax=Vibrio tapetis subsp. tapetis TaxID=1671868 RepID=A0A2N8ZMY2_9VIBR|nr:glucoamylase family protein [Vibrio tapetis]SON53219.1 putative membrane protein [Vibrio tapetis subsp. tapetis]
MKKILTSLTGVIALSLTAIADAGAVTIDSLVLRDHLYPTDFQAELQNNLNFFIDGVGVDPETKVPFDTILVKDGIIEHRYYVNTSEIGLYLNILVEADKGGTRHAIERIAEVLDTLEKAPHWNGLFYWPYDIVGKELKPVADGTVPAVDNGNLAFALAGVAGAFLNSEDELKQSISKRIEKILDAQKPGWVKLYDEQRGLMVAGWSTQSDSALSYYVDRMANESRLAPMWAALITADMGGDAVPASAFNDMELYTKQYQYKGRTYNPMLTWDGAYFQAMLPAIWLNEEELMPDYTMVRDMTFIQMAYAAEHNIPLVSSSATVDDEYAAFGVPYLSESKVKFSNEIHDGKTGTPHAVALSYIVDPDTAVQALKSIKKNYPEIESPYGWYDALDSEGRMSTKILSLDQGMFVGAFLADEINADVKRYLDSKGYSEAVEEMYQSFVPNKG